ncbi:hypothetical protein [Psychrobacillus sp.]|uniref:hypothetical protein n=1 Tax=Psychrobacillus sp. TaxID=1871623 RepID=UPI0028BDAD3B|nr:hypothetical protein [Psychrobacillus sp.]
MIGKPIKLSRESEKQIIIQELSCFGIHQTSNGEQLQTLDYFSLLNMLAVQKAIRS